MAQAQILYVGTTRGLEIFSNPGRSGRWIATGAELQGQAILALDCAPSQPLEVRAAVESGVLLSRDGGQTWQPAAQEQHPPLPAQQIELSGRPSTLLRIAAGAIERSEDDGQSWQATAVPAGGAITLLLAAPYHPDITFAGSETGEVLMSTDRGRSWQALVEQLPTIVALAAGRAL